MSVVGARGARKRVLWLVLLPLVALACVLLALAAGASRAHWLPVAAFLAIAATGGACFWMDLRMLRRLARRQRQTELRWGIRYREPFWMPLANAMLAIGFGALLAAIPAAVGFPSVGIGVVMCFGVLAFLMSAGFGPRGLSLETGGVRFHVRGGRFVVPWTTIATVERIGPDHSLMIRLHVHDANLVIDSHEPKRPRVRKRVEFCVEKNNGGGGVVMLLPWTGGLDGPTLARTIDAAIRGKPDRVN